MNDEKMMNDTTKEYNRKIKLHTCEEGGAHLIISFWHLLMNLKNK